MMRVNAVFHIYECKKYNGHKLLDGRLLHDIKITDELIVLGNVDIKFYNCNCDKDGSLIINDKVKYEKVQIKKIFSYGEYWESLPSGMSARLECYCNMENLTNLLLCKIVEM
ncbi:MAG: hypothetical protein HDT39_01155 [Lachnospiraceae bacterium]|nr:hypothetical protein [Lachnospiraceae bacterium]